MYNKSLKKTADRFRAFFGMCETQLASLALAIRPLLPTADVRLENFFHRIVYLDSYMFYRCEQPPLEFL